MILLSGVSLIPVLSFWVTLPGAGGCMPLFFQGAAVVVVGSLWCFSTECMRLGFFPLAMNGLLVKCFVFDEHTIGVR